MTSSNGVSPGFQNEDGFITVEALYQRISQPNDVVILDVRNVDEFAAWRIEGRFTPRTINIPYFEFFENQDQVIQQVPEDAEIVVVCAKGGASDFVAAVLDEHGRRALNLADGMAAWGEFYVVRPIIEAAAYQIYQIERPARGCLSHVLISAGQAVIIDPLRHVQQYLDFLAEKSARLAFILDTHAHADHISGGFALQETTSAPYHLHPFDAIHPFDMLPTTRPFHMLADGMTFELGALHIEVIHTPGHTLGQVNFLISTADGKSFLCSGDTLFIESFGRPDLGGQGERWAPVVYESLFQRLRQRVPEHALVLPGHYARPDEANQGGAFARPLAQLWAENSGLQHSDQEEFITYVLSHLPAMPQEYVEIKRVNIGLSQPDEDTINELELGKNICALSDAY